jgi:uncharacterized protein YjbJ (UPF0337 family)
MWAILLLRQPKIPRATGQKCTRCSLIAAFGTADNEEDAMNWDRVEGNWKQFTGKVKEKWGKLTEDDITVINGKQDQLVGRIQERYGVAKDEAEKQVKTWVGGL